MKEKVLVSLDTATIKQFDEICGIVPRSAYIRRMIINEIAAVGVQSVQELKTHYDMAQNPLSGGAVNV
ncbi:hypothetical protein KAX97_14625 [candidate division WOR-3 bacterium]|nr:hypothetical protein [candidate division WOR-3 bacterium]